MGLQMFLDEYMGSTFEIEKECLRILNWNVRNPSYHRATKQCRYIEKLKPHIILLTELKSPNGTKYFEERLAYLGYNIFYEPSKDDYFILIASIFESYEIPVKIDFLPCRIKMIEIKKDINIRFIGIYVPSRGPKEKRNIKKRKFQYSVIDVLDKLKRKGKTQRLIIGGDLNVIDPLHIPKYSIFGNWEYEFYNKFIEIGLVDAFWYLNTHQDYSWFGRSGDGYRFDHLFVSKDLQYQMKRCYYDHSVRLSKLSDHSAMILEIEL